MFDKITYRLLKKLYRSDSLTKDEVESLTYTPPKDEGNKHVSFLLENKLISESFEGYEMDKNYRTKGGKTVYRITLPGRAYIEQKRRNLFNFWVPYIITTLIAIAGLLVAIAGFLHSAP